MTNKQGTIITVDSHTVYYSSGNMFSGCIGVYENGNLLWTQSTNINRTTRKDALNDAEHLKADIEQKNQL